MTANSPIGKYFELLKVLKLNQFCHIHLQNTPPLTWILLIDKHFATYACYFCMLITTFLAILEYIFNSYPLFKRNIFRNVLLEGFIHVHNKRFSLKELFSTLFVGRNINLNQKIIIIS